MGDSVRVWHPTVPFVREVLHATFEHHVYPAHTHDAWAVLMVDDGAVAYDLDRTGHFAVPDSVTLLPPHVPHNGRSAVGGETYRKRVIYLDEDWLPTRLEVAAVARPTLQGNAAAATVAGIHAALRSPGEAMAAECGILSLQEIVQGHLGTASSRPRDVPLARRLRQMLDDRLAESFTITEAARVLGISQAYGIAPHRYVTGAQGGPGKTAPARRPRGRGSSRGGGIPRPGTSYKAFPTGPGDHTGHLRGVMRASRLG